MKAESAVTAAIKPPRNTIYSRPAAKRNSSAIHQLNPVQSFSPSRGVSKSRTKSAATLASPRRIASVNRSPKTLIALELQRQRQQQIIALEREVRGLLEEEYREDVKRYMYEMEALTMCSAASIDMQPELQWHMRGCLVEFLIEVHLNFRLRPETLYLTCNIVDRYVSRRVVYKKHYQLVGCAALWIAAKFEDAKERVPTVKDLCEICRNAYDESAFIQMEGHVLATIAWKVGHPTAEAWLRVACCGICFEDSQTQHIARFLMEITLFYRDYVQFTPSVIADASLMLARYTLGKQRRPFQETEEIITVVRILDAHLAEHLDELSQTLVKKYSHSYYSKASTFIVQYYLQGHRYVFVPPIVPPPSLAAPSTPLRSHRMQTWASSSSSISSTPSFSGSDFTDFSSETEDESMPRTPRTPSAPVSTNTSVVFDPFSIHGMSLGSGSANKENLPIVSTSQHSSHVPVAASVSEGRRSRKSSMENVDPAMMDLCQPSPASREATYIPRAALHSLTGNGPAQPIP